MTETTSAQRAAAVVAKIRANWKDTPKVKYAGRGVKRRQHAIARRAVKRIIKHQQTGYLIRKQKLARAA